MIAKARMVMNPRAKWTYEKLSVSARRAPLEGVSVCWIVLIKR